MAGARYVLLGLAGARSAWFRDVAQWANAGSIPAEFVKCVSAEEVRARLASGRSFSALLVDGAAAGLDRDLVDAAQQAGCAAIVVDDRRSGRDWASLGANATMGAAFDRQGLLELLASHTVMIGRVDRIVTDLDEGPAAPWHAPLAAVCGTGGTGASTAAVALAQGLADDVRSSGAVVLADLVLHAEQAMLHDARDVVPGVQELVELFRSGQPTQEEIRALTFAVRERQYSLLLGLRRARTWTAIRPRAFAAALEGLRRSFRIVVADVDAEVEGEDEGGSMDVEERHTMARTTMAAADGVLVVGSPGMKGLHAMVRVISDLLAFGVPGARVLPVINRAPRSARSRSELTAAVASLLPAWAGAEMPSPVFLPERHVDEAFRDGVRLPSALTSTLARAFLAVTDRADADARRPVAPQRVEPGSVGSWTPQIEAAER